MRFDSQDVPSLTMIDCAALPWVWSLRFVLVSKASCTKLRTSLLRTLHLDLFLLRKVLQLLAHVMRSVRVRQGSALSVVWHDLQLALV